MATSIITDFDSIYLTSLLPEEVSFETDAASLNVAVFLNSTKVFSSDYYPYQEVVTVRDICSIVEAAMLKNRWSMATLKLVATEPVSPPSSVSYDEDGNMYMTYGEETPQPETESVEDIKVVYCRLKWLEDSEDFLLYRFLTTRRSALIPRSGQLMLSHYTKAYAQGLNTALIYYSVAQNPGEVLTYTHTMESMQSNTETIVTTNLTHSYFKSIVDQNMGCYSTVLGAEYRIGSRQFNIFFTDEEPTETFTFLNAFNVTETAYLYNTTTIKTEVDRSEAICGKTAEFYDQTVRVKHEVETASLAYDEAKWLNQLLTSRLVRHSLEDGTLQEVLISDISSEISNSDKELIRLKFSYKYTDANEYLL